MENTAAIGAVPRRRRRRRRDRRRVSEVLRVLIEGHQEPRITVRQLRDALGDRAYGVLFFVFALPNLVPMPPGVTTLFAIPLLVLAAQFCYAGSYPYFPNWIGNRSFARTDFEKALTKIRPTLRRVERLLQPRLLWLTGTIGERVLGAFFFVLAIVMCVPIPLGHWLPAVATCVMALALVERDGVVLLGGVVIGLASLAIVLLVLLGIASTVDFLWLGSS